MGRRSLVVIARLSGRVSSRHAWDSTVPLHCGGARRDGVPPGQGTARHSLVRNGSFDHPSKMEQSFIYRCARPPW